MPAGSILAIVGDVNAGKAIELVNSTFGGWSGAAPAGMELPAVAVKKYPGRKLLVVNNTLGGGFTSRLMDEIRVNRRLSYGARSSLTQLKAGGYFSVMTYTKNKTLRETIDVALEQVRKIRTEKMSDTELTSSKKYLSGLFPFDIETNNDLASWLGDLSFYKLPIDYVEGYRDHVDKVTPGDAMKVAGEHFWVDDNLILLLTNYEETKDQLKGLGEAQVVNFDQLK